MDTYIIDKPQSDIDRRNVFSTVLLKNILDKTVAKYGPYKIKVTDSYMERERLFNEMLSGKEINITAQTTQVKWEDSLIPVRIPIDKGISCYKVLFIRKEMQSYFYKVKTLSKLKSSKLGVGSQWPEYNIYSENGFNVISGINYDGLFSMLQIKRFSYFPREINEVFTEYKMRKSLYPDMTIEKSILIYFPLPKYFFVSPSEPGLARRIEVGLNLMIADGSFGKLVYSYHSSVLKNTNFKSRRLFQIPNPFLSSETPLNRKELWFNPYLK